MARDPRYVHCELLTDAIAQARTLVTWPINKAEMRGALVRVDAPGEAVYFRLEARHAGQIDEATGQFMATAGGDSYALALVLEGDRAEAEARWNGGEARRGFALKADAGRLRFAAATAACLIAVASYFIGLWVGSR